jgi:hypothetical protein
MMSETKPIEQNYVSLFCEIKIRIFCNGKLFMKVLVALFCCLVQLLHQVQTLRELWECSITNLSFVVVLTKWGHYYQSVLSKYKL